MNKTINIQPMPSAPIQKLILELAEKKLQNVNYQTGNHELLIPYLGQTISLEILFYRDIDGYIIEVMNNLF